MSFQDLLLQQIINGVSLGAMYALLALGFTMVYGIIELINFAHFNVFMVGSATGCPGLIARWDGTAVRRTCVSSATFLSIDGTSLDDIWATDLDGGVWHYTP